MPEAHATYQVTGYPPTLSRSIGNFMAADAMSPPPRRTSCYRLAKTPGLSIVSSFTLRGKRAPRNHLTPITPILPPEQPTTRRKNTSTTVPLQAPRNQKAVSRVAGAVPILSCRDQCLLEARYSRESTSAIQLASMMLSETPTVPQESAPSLERI